MGLKNKVALFSFLLIKFATSADTTNGTTSSTCGAEMKAHLECTIKARKLNNPPSVVTISRKELEDGLTSCFTANSCLKPILEDHGVSTQMTFLPNANTNLYGNCSKSIRNVSKSDLEKCIDAKIPGFAFYDEPESDRPKMPDMSANLVASYWIYSTSMQIHNSSICPNSTTVNTVRKCCNDQFAKVFACHNPFNDLQESADRFDSACKASVDCSKQLSANCVQNYSNNIAVIKECLRKQFETEKEKKDLTNKFITCMKTTADNHSNYLMEPKMAEFQAQMSISKWVEALPEHPEMNCSKSGFWDQFKQQPLGMSINGPRPGTPQHGSMVGSAVDGPAQMHSLVAAAPSNPVHDGAPQPPPPPPPPPPAIAATAGATQNASSSKPAMPPGGPPPPPPPPPHENPPANPPPQSTGTPATTKSSHDTTPTPAGTTHSIPPTTKGAAAKRRRRNIRRL